MSGHLQLASSVSVDVSPQPAADPIQVIVADDHASMRRSLRRLLESEPNIEVIADENIEVITSELTSVVRHVHGQRPPVLVLDLGMFRMSGLHTIGQLRERVPGTQIVVVTTEENPAFAQRALRAGALGFVSQDRADTDLTEAVHVAARDEAYLSPSLAAKLAALHRSLTSHDLTVREVEVLRLIALGHTTVEIARKLHNSPRTIETHRAHIQRKLGVRTRAELVRYALRRGLLSA
jgi:two-component system, NarL family, response regulator NreC